MEFSGIPMDQDHTDAPNFTSYNSSTSFDEWTDHVKWQGSQTACTALNQLIKSSANESAQDAPRTSGWQRVSSYDQLSSLSLTSHHETASHSSWLSSRSRPSSSKPSLSSRSHSRARLSETRAPAPDITNLDLPIPLFNKTNPMQFLDIMKGVSARLDENAGVRPRKELNPESGPSSSRAKKRTRRVSLGGASELQVRKATRGIVKKGRVDELRIADTLTREGGKGKGRATSEDEGLDLEVRGRGLQGYSSLPDMHSRSDLKRGFSSKDVSFMDVDDKDDNTDTEDISHSAASSSSSSNHGYPDTRPTLSQTEMPPPPFICDSFVHKQRHSNLINESHTSYPHPQQLPTNHPIKQRKPDAIPKLHPLLHHKSSSSTAMSVPQVQPQHHPAPIPAPEGPDLKPPPSSLSTPVFSNTPSSRPPALGMRRNRTFPSRPSSSPNVQQFSSSLTGSGGHLPQRQKGFKPPLLSLSQPQAQTQTYVRTNTNESGSMITTNRKVPSQNLPEASFINNHGFNTTSNNTSMALRSSSSSSDSSTLFRSTPPTTSSAPSYSSNPSVSCRSKKSNQKIDQPPVVDIPEPLDGDGDSSFGEMSFDLDALEETMKMYD